MAYFPMDKFREFVKKPETSVKDVGNETDIQNVENVSTNVISEEALEKEEFNSLNLSTDELMEIKKIALSDILEQDISISELVDLVLLSKSGKKVKEKNKDGLLIREYVDREGKITRQGRLYLEFDETRERLKKLLK